jgi:integrase
LLTGGEAPVFIPTKGKRARVIDIAPETVDLLRTHKADQARIKLQHRPHYHDHGLVFAKEWRAEGRRQDGLPLGINNIGEREFATLIAAARCRRSRSMGSVTLAPVSSWRQA